MTDDPSDQRLITEALNCYANFKVVGVLANLCRVGYIFAMNIS